MPDIIAGKYEVLETIGRGGMGTVYKARQINLDRIVAIKMLSEELASDPEFRARFQQEATVVARLNHPNIVQVHDIEPHKNTFCIIMEFVDGENLQAKIDRDVTLPEAEAMRIGAQVSRALAYAHTRGIIHRDIKPDNIHVTPKGVAKVMDFGIARFLDSKLKTQTGISMGTPKFMSPEQVTGKNVDGQTDLYSLGVCLYYCLAGRPPFDGENAISVATRHLYEQPEAPSKFNPSISPAVESAVLKALEKQKQNRYKTGLEMADALEAALGTKTPVRLGAETDATFGAATMKMPSQAYTPRGSGSVDQGLQPVSPSGETRFTSPNGGADAAGGSLAGAGVVGTAGVSSSTSPVPQLDAGFRTPENGTGRHDGETGYRRTLLTFGGVLVATVILLILLVLWLRRSNAITDAPGGKALSVPAAQRVEAVRAEAHRLITANKFADARKLLLEFREQHPDLKADQISRDIQVIESQLPVTDSRLLAKLRHQEAFTALNSQERALALAYMKGAIALSPDLAQDAITTNTLQNLEKKLAGEPATAGKQSAAQVLAQAKSHMQSGDYGAGTRKLLVQAVETDYSNPVAWESLGDFFLKTRNVDSARVMYREAAEKAQEPVLRAHLQTKLAGINQ